MKTLCGIVVATLCGLAILLAFYTISSFEITRQIPSSQSVVTVKVTCLSVREERLITDFGLIAEEAVTRSGTDYRSPSFSENVKINFLFLDREHNKCKTAMAVWTKVKVHS